MDLCDSRSCAQSESEYATIDYLILASIKQIPTEM